MPTPTKPRSIAAPRKSAEPCKACDLWKAATRTVFGEGAARAPFFFIGEQAGDREDREGRPFVGPAGQLLDEVLAEVGIDRPEAYVTNIVKHFKFTVHPAFVLRARAGGRGAEVVEAIRADLMKLRDPPNP